MARTKKIDAVNGMKELVARLAELKAKQVADAPTPEDSKESADTKRAKAIAHQISKMGSVCSSGKREIAALLSVALGLKIPVTTASTSNRDNLMGMFLVPTHNTQSHNYAIGKVIMGNNNDICMKQSGDIGNHISLAETRLATADEIDKFIRLLIMNVEGDEAFFGSQIFDRLMGGKR